MDSTSAHPLIQLPKNYIKCMDTTNQYDVFIHLTPDVNTNYVVDVCLLKPEVTINISPQSLGMTASNPKDLFTIKGVNLDWVLDVYHIEFMVNNITITKFFNILQLCEFFSKEIPISFESTCLKFVRKTHAMNKLGKITLELRKYNHNTSHQNTLQSTLKYEKIIKTPETVVNKESEKYVLVNLQGFAVNEYIQNVDYSLVKDDKHFEVDRVEFICLTQLHYPMYKNMKGYSGGNHLIGAKLYSNDFFESEVYWKTPDVEISKSVYYTYGIDFRFKPATRPDVSETVSTSYGIEIGTSNLMYGGSIGVNSKYIDTKPPTNYKEYDPSDLDEMSDRIRCKLVCMNAKSFRISITPGILNTFFKNTINKNAPCILELDFDCEKFQELFEYVNVDYAHQRIGSFNQHTYENMFYLFQALPIYYNKLLEFTFYVNGADKVGKEFFMSFASAKHIRPNISGTILEQNVCSAHYKYISVDNSTDYPTELKVLPLSKDQEPYIYYELDVPYHGQLYDYDLVMKYGIVKKELIDFDIVPLHNHDTLHELLKNDGTVKDKDVHNYQRIGIKVYCEDILNQIIGMNQQHTHKYIKHILDKITLYMNYQTIKYFTAPHAHIPLI
uniref:Uncharacterized protein n=1 Tax=viral metagenome TaxID=1070528 RepID=A0A6C0CKN6_9ZZZZ